MSLLRSIKRVQAQFAATRVEVPSIDVEGRSVLIVYLFNGLGDAVLLAPAVRALIELGAEVELLLPPLAARIWRHVDLQVGLHEMPKVILEDDAARARGERKRSSKAAAKARRELEASLGEFDVAVDLTLRGGVDSRRWLRAPVRVGWGDDDDQLTWSAPDTRTRTDVHWARRQLEPLACFGGSAFDPSIPFHITGGARRKAAGKWGDGPRLLVVPGSRSEDKLWAAHVEATLAAAAGSVVVTGAPWEADDIRSIAREVGGKLYCGKDLATLIALVEAADVVLTNDTGPMHLAFALERPTVAVFTHMAPAVWGPVADPDGRHFVWRPPEGAVDTTDVVVQELRHRLAAAR